MFGLVLTFSSVHLEQCHMNSRPCISYQYAWQYRSREIKDNPLISADKHMLKGSNTCLDNYKFAQSKEKPMTSNMT
jgi:hypothetical protein